MICPQTASKQPNTPDQSGLVPHMFEQQDPGQQLSS